MKRTWYCIWDGSAYYRHGHWINAIEIFAKALEGEAKIVIAAPERAKIWFSPDIQSKFEFFDLPNSEPYQTFLGILYHRSGIQSKSVTFSNILAVAKQVRQAIVEYFLYLLRVRRNIARSKQVAQEIFDTGVKAFIFPTGDNFHSHQGVTKKIVSLGGEPHVRFVNSEPLAIRRWSRSPVVRRLNIAIENRRISEYFKMFKPLSLEVVLFPAVKAPSSRVDTKVWGRSSELSELSIGTLGAPRESKGYKDLPEIVRQATQSTNCNWSLQVLDGDAVWAEFSLVPRIRLLPEILTNAELAEEIKRLDVMVLPYSQRTYARTASAMLLEAAESGVPIIAPFDTGLGSLIQEFGIGWTYSNLAQISDIVAMLQSSSGRKELKAAKESCHMLNEIRNQQLLRWLDKC